MTFIAVLSVVVMVVAWVALALLAIAIAATAVPFEATYDSARPRARLRLTYLWGAARLYPRPEGRGKKNGRKAKSTKAKEKKRKKRSEKEPNPNRRREFLNLLRDSGFRQRALSDLIRLLRRIEIRRVDLHARLGLADPADTAVLYGTVAAALAAAGIDPQAGLGPDERHRLKIEPVFDQATFDLAGTARLRIVPLRLLGSMLCIVGGSTGRRIIGALWRTRK